jgi:integrase
LPFFGELGVSEVTPGKVQDYRVHRATTPSTDEVRTPKPATDKPPAHKPPSRSTLHVLRDNLAERDGSHLDCRAALHDEIVTLRLALKTAIRHGWLTHLPDLSPPYRTQGKAVHRAWLSPAEYKQLYETTREYAKTPALNHYRWNAEQVHDYVLFLANTGLRPDEAKNPQHRDVTIATDDATRQKILEIEVRGKRGVGHCNSTSSAVRPYERLLARALPGLPQGKRARIRRGETGTGPVQEDVKKYPQPTDHVFPGNHIKLFNGVLTRTKLKLDRDGNRRTACSLRHSYICMRLMECGYLSDREELSHQRRDDREILRGASEAHARCRRHQRSQEAAEPTTAGGRARR